MINTIFAERYRITGQLGRGTYGTVYAGHDLHTDQQVAIKIPAREQEVQMISRLQHEALPRYLDSGQVGDQRYLVMTKFDADPLSCFFQQHPCIPLHFFGHLVEQLLEIFLYLQQRSVIYTDFHDDNLLYHPQTRRLALVDFSFARSGRCREYTPLDEIENYLLPHLEEPHRTSVEAWLLQIRSDYEGYIPSLLGIQASWRALLYEVSLSKPAHCP